VGDGEAEFEVFAMGGGIGVGASEDGVDETIELSGTGDCTENGATGACSQHGSMDGKAMDDGRLLEERGNEGC